MIYVPNQTRRNFFSSSLCLWLFAVEVTFIVDSVSHVRLEAEMHATTIDVTIFLWCDCYKVSETFSSAILLEGDSFLSGRMNSIIIIIIRSWTGWSGSLHNLFGDDEQWKKFSSEIVENFNCCVVKNQKKREIDLIHKFLII